MTELTLIRYQAVIEVNNRMTNTEATVINKLMSTDL